jgi:hypothetical protein
MHYTVLSESSFSFYIALEGPSSGAATIKDLKGSIALTMGKKRNLHVLSDKPLSAKGAKFRCVSGAIEITAARNSPEGYELTYTCPFPTPGLNKLEIQVMDAKGQLFESHKGQSTSEGEKWQSTEIFTPPANSGPVPAKLCCAWWETIEYHVPFEFHGVPLP